MGHERVSSGACSDAAAKRLAGRAHWSQISLSLVLFCIHHSFSLMWIGLVRKLSDWISNPSGRKRRPDGSDGALERNLVRGSDANTNLPDPCLQPIAECDRLATDSAWSGNDLYLSMDGRSYAAVWDTKCICRRSVSSLIRHTAISIPGESRTCTHRARVCSFCAWDRRQRGRR